MKKIFAGLLLTSVLWTASPADAATPQLKIDEVVVKTDAAPEVKNNRTMVPLRVISENLGAQVQWKGSQITLSTNQSTVILTLNSQSVIQNGQAEQLDTTPYLKNNRTYVPIRFIAETFGSQVDYKQSTVNIATKPLFINNQKIKALHYEYHMTMGGVIQEVKGHSYHHAMYKIFLQKGDKVEAPKDYSWQLNLDIPGSYYKLGQYDFLNADNKSVQQFDTYSLNQAFPDELLKGYPTLLLHDVYNDSWYIFSDNKMQSIQQLMNAATNNGFNKIISNTVL
ncbi:copper amine oxidase N-terminal domain-containing protein [Lysinibacillus fusiformis]|uniref:copper amine oxidase N-terminal domain-containing protein n=1 Tax=Lysinibacillus fusiformis TaxID=28031 RepID=UPI0021C1266A|nr:copper amine oxidase N-terminal domain-containing protein [Lysinibacillus fusiformis]UXJ70969.1 copper amine oxidase N-terminal domain-containing protein [Lysinibacillus fusiformis]